MYITPDSYQHSRDLFIKDLKSIKSHWRSAELSSFVISDIDDLTIDWISANPEENPEKLLFLSTGLHGIEGYLGSIMLQLFVKEFIYLLDPSKVGILIVHCINPSGMKRRYRTNTENVDLNRNFIEDFNEMRNSNPDYLKLNPFFNLKSPIKQEGLTKLLFIIQTIKWLKLMGASRVREAALMGQFFDPSGMYFGGFEHQAETKCMMKMIKDWIPRYLKTIHLDMHTGYGPRNQMTLVQTPSEPMSSDEAKARFNLPRVAVTNPEEFYTINGEMSQYIYKEANKLNRKVYSAAFEFGTYGDGIYQGARSLLTTIAGNQKLKYQSTKNSWVEREYDELYFPSNPAWLETAIQNGREGFRGILKAEGFI